MVEDMAQQVRICMQVWGPEFGVKYSSKKVGVALHQPIIPRDAVGAGVDRRIHGVCC